jgi:hypothetical protein
MVLLFSLGLLMTGAFGSRFAFTAQTVMPTLHVPIMLLAGVWAVTLVLSLYLFPNGRFEPRPLAVVALLTLPLFLVFSDVAQVLVTMPALPEDVPVWRLGLIVAVMFVNYSLALAGQIYRYWRVSGPVERQQTKWVLAAFSGVMVALAALLVAQLAGVPEELTAVGILLSSVPVLFLPIAVALAVLHRGLWDVDRLLNRTVPVRLGDPRTRRDIRAGQLARTTRARDADGPTVGSVDVRTRRCRRGRISAAPTASGRARRSRPAVTPGTGAVLHRHRRLDGASDRTRRRTMA